MREKILNVVLFQPQIPQNTGNVARTCAAVGCKLCLIPPMGFSMDAAKLKRAGLDYWPEVHCKTLSKESLEATILRKPQNCWFFTSKATQRYNEVSYQSGDVLIFGSETAGLPPEWIERFPRQAVQIPKRAKIRCLNLATAVGIGLYEAWRQQEFAPLS